jgi:hypothetical protein
VIGPVVLALKSQTPFPIAPCLIASRSYNVRGILIALANMVADTPFLEQVCKRFLLIRCFLWLVVELGQVWDSQFELTGSVIGSGSEVDEIFESSGHSFC